MASLRFMSFPSTTDLQTHLFSLLHKSHSPSNNLSFPRTIRNPVALNFSATAQHEEQERAVDSSPDIPRKVNLARLAIKGLPFDATAEDVRSLAEQYGAVLDVEVSMFNKTRNRGLAFVSFSTADEARAALNNIKEIDGCPLIVNYAYQRLERKPYSAPRTFNLYVANLPLDATKKDLKEFFKAEYDSVHYVEIIHHKNPEWLSCYGYVGFKTKKHADAACVAFKGKMFMGRRIDVLRSNCFIKDRKRKENPQTYAMKSDVLSADASQVETAEEN